MRQRGAYRDRFAKIAQLNYARHISALDRQPPVPRARRQYQMVVPHRLATA